MAEHQINFRLDDEYNQKLENVAAIEEKKPSAMAQEMVKESLNFWWKKRRDTTFPFLLQ